VPPETVTAWQHHLSGPFGLDDLTRAGILPRVWTAHWVREPGRVVLRDGHDPSSPGLTGGALEERTAAAAATLAAAGVTARDRVLWGGESSLDSIVWLLGAMRLSAVVVPVSAAITASELAYVTQDVQPSAAILERAEQRSWVTAAAAGVLMVTPSDPLDGSMDHVALDLAQPDDDALIVYTSGTTGKPKGAVHTHRSLLAGVEAIRLAWDWQSHDRLILALPLFHVHGLCAGLFGTLAAGASAVVLERFTPDGVLGAVGESTMFFGVPTMYHRLAECRRASELSGLRLCVSGSAPLPVALWERLHDEGIDVLERYGMSETLLTVSNPLRGERRPGTVGFPLPGTEATIADPDEDGVGELKVKGPSCCRGYWQRPQDSATQWDDHGWFATGDLASVDPEGYFSIRGRLTELIITGGHNVYPAEVEAVLIRHPSVRDVAVVGIESDEWGESVTAFVVAEGTPDVEGVARLAAEELAPYKRPREIRVVAELPRNAMGKVLRRQLR
jgi:malonyl-CoA/methylmalonyl-CoA synthetase